MKLTVLYDGECGLCRRCRDWLKARDRGAEIEFLAMQSPAVNARFPDIRRMALERSLTAVDDRGRVYRGDDAWIACLSTVPAYRRLARGVSHPFVRPLTRRVYWLVAGQRRRISRWLGMDCEGSCHV